MIRRALRKVKSNKYNIDEFVKNHYLDGTVKSSRCKARESLGMRRTKKYAAVTKDEAQSRRGGTDGLFTKPSILSVKAVYATEI